MKKRFISCIIVFAMFFTCVTNVFAFNGGTKINFVPYPSQRECKISSWFKEASEELELVAYEDLTSYDIRWNAFVLILRAMQAHLKSENYNILSANGATLTEFTDIYTLTPDAQSEAKILKGLGVLSGRTDEHGNLSMQMTGYITRAEFAKIVTVYTQKFFEIDEIRSYKGFEDMDDHWAEKYVSYCYERGFVDGRSSDCYDPDGAITKEEIIKILLNILEETDITIENVAKALNETYAITTKFDDKNSTNTLTSSKIVTNITPYEYSYTVREGKSVVVKVKYNENKNIRVTNINKNLSIKEKSISDGIAKITVEGEDEGAGILKFEYTTGSSNTAVYIPVFVTNTSTIRVRSIGLDDTTIYLDVGDVYHMASNITVSPSYADVYYCSSDTDVANVNYSSGLVTAKKRGKTYIYVLSNGITKKIKVEVSRSYSNYDDDGYDDIELKENYGTMYIDSTMNLANKVKYVDDRYVTYSSSNTKIASISSKGIVTAKKEGDVVIKIKCDGVTLKYDLSVIDDYDSDEEVEEIIFKKAYAELEVGDTFNLYDYVKVIPTYAPMDNIKYYSLDDDIAVVSKYTGVIKAVSEGYTQIKVTVDGVLQYFDVYVENEFDDEILASDIVIDLEDIYLDIYETYSLSRNVSVFPSDTTDTVYYTSSDEDVVTVDELTGFIKAVGKGRTIITVKAGNVKEIIPVYVSGEEFEENPDLNEDPIQFLREEVNIYVGMTFNPYSLLSQTDGLSFSLSSTKYAILENDKVVANAKGDVTLYVKDANGNTDSILIHIKE